MAHKQSMTITASGRILYSPLLESLHPMHRIVGDHKDRPYDAMTDIDGIGQRNLSVLESLHPMHRIVGDHKDRPYDAMTDIACIGCKEPPRYAN